MKNVKREDKKRQNLDNIRTHLKIKMKDHFLNRFLLIITKMKLRLLNSKEIN